ncbi:NUDIX hydrolase [Corynebacterium lizhenjunii]|uniref:NUDIX hydrolase n=2 Tax=Corynebacterium lizhenjunii TaxID=2709394 RepID=A0A7T0PAV0_9CORY|nr:NUDIX hydrolase [Corynebacterium lizhenjunii]
MLLDAPIIAVRADTVTMPGGSVARREIVEHLGAVAVVALNAAGQVRLVRQYRHSVGQRLWELPAGLLDVKGETELECARRELQEEAGLAAAEWGVLVDIVTSPGFCEEAVRIFIAQDLREVARPAHPDDEEADMIHQWVPLEQAVDMVLRGEIVNGIAVAGLLAAARGAQPRPTSVPFELRPTAMAARRPGPDLKAL